MRRFRASMIVFAVVSMMAPVAAFAQEQTDDSAQTEVTDQVGGEEQPAEGDTGSDLEGTSSSDDADGAGGELAKGSQDDAGNGDESAGESDSGEQSTDDVDENDAAANDSAAGDQTETSEQNSADEETPAVSGAEIEPGDVTVTITKVVVDGDGTETFAINQTAPTFDSFFVGDTDTFPISAPPGTAISLEEPVVGFWRATSIVCDEAEVAGPWPDLAGAYVMDIVVGTTDVACTVTNEQLPTVLLTVNKVVDGLDTGELFDIGVWNQDIAFYPDFISATDGSTDSIEVPGNTALRFEEYFPSGWSLDELSCSNATTTLLESGDFGASGVITTTDVDATCTFTNSPPPPVELTVTKVVEGGDGTETFDFFFGDGTVVLGNDGSHTASVPRGSWFSFAETIVDGWYASDFSCNADSAVSTEPGTASFSVLVGSDVDAIACTVTNSAADNVSFSLTKIATDDPSVSFTFFDYFSTGEFMLADGDDYTLDVSPGSVLQFVEYVPDGWTAAALDCTGAADVWFSPNDSFGPRASLSITVGTVDVACTLTNVIPQRVDLTIEKVAAGAESGASFDFVVSYEEPIYERNEIAVPANGTATVSVPASGLVDITESLAAGWVYESVECTNASVMFQQIDGATEGYARVRIGETDASCTITNRAVPTVDVTITKILEGDRSDQIFDFAIDGGRSIGVAADESATFEVNPGSPFLLVERYPFGWAGTEFVCIGDEGHYIDWVGETQTSFSVVAGDDPIECTVTNTPVPAVQVTVVKEVIGDIAEDFDMRWSTFGPETFLDGSFEIGDGGSSTFSVPPGSTVQIEEFGAPDLLTSWRMADFDCVGASSEVNNNFPGYAAVQISIADTDATCTFTNEAFAPPTLIVTKAVQGEDPSGGAHDFEISTPDGSVTLAAGESSAAVDLPGPGFFRISEWLGSNNADWVAVDVVCMVGDEDVTQYVELSPFSEFVEAEFLADWNDSVECTVTNRANAATLSIAKQLEGGSSDQVFRFDLNNRENVFLLGDGDSATFSVRPGSFPLTESVSVGWELSAITCTNADGATITGPAEMQIDIAVDAQVECVVTNTAVEPATVSITKVVTGDGPPASFSFGSPQSVFETVAAGETRTFQVNPGQLELREFAPSGWKLTDWTCTGATVLETNIDENFLVVDVQPAAALDCTVTNDWDPDASVTITKMIEGVDPADGGRPFSFYVAGNSVEISPGVPQVVGLNAGFVNIQEFIPEGWSSPSIECDQPDRVDFVNTRAGYLVLEVQDGDDLACTFTNRRVSPTEVTITKHAPGSSESFDFEGPHGSFTLSHGESKTFLANNAYFQVYEIVRAGWRAEVSCEGGVDWVASSSRNPTNEEAYEGAFIGPATGAPVECMFVNSPQPTGQLTITKAVSGDPTTDAFNFITPTGTVNLAAGDSFTFTVRPDELSRLTEIPSSPGWQLVDIECAGDGIGQQSIDIDNASISVAVAAGGDVECTFTNARSDEPEPARITVVKRVEGVDALTDPALASTEFNFVAGASFSLADGESQVIEVASGFPANRFIEELVPLGWGVRELSCDSGSWIQTSLASLSINVQPGDDITCTFVNEPVDTATIVLTKIAADAADGETFTFSTPVGLVELAAGESTTFAVNAGVGALVESLGAAWTADTIDCSGGESQPLFFAAGVQYSLNSGDELNCVFTNVPRPAAIVNITKVIGDGSSTDRQFDFTTDTGLVTVAAGETVPVTISPGFRFISERPQSGFELDSLSCDGGDPVRRGAGVELFLVAGQEVNCTFVNRPVAPINVSLTKRVTGFDDGSAFDFYVNGEVLTLGGGDNVDFEAAPGFLTIAEVPGLDWRVIEISCERRRSLFVERFDFYGTVDTTVVPGDEVACEFVNELREQPATGSLEIVKMVAGDDGGERHHFVDPFGRSFDLAAGETHVMVVAAGVANTVTETLLPEWTLGEITCVGADAWSRDRSSLAVTVADGGAASCTFVNEAPAPPPDPDPDPVVTIGGEPADPDGPVALPRDEFEVTYDAGAECVGLTGTWTLRDANGIVVATGVLNDDGVSGVYVATVSPPAVFDPAFDFSALTVDYEVPCEGLPPVITQPVEFIDPAGTIVDCVGDLVAGATVTLLREDDSVPGVFAAVANGDGAVIDLTVNGENPITTDATGSFQWFTIAGNYRVDATFNGVSGSSTVLPVPPEQIDVVIELDLNCPAPKSLDSPTITATPDAFVVHAAAPVADSNEARGSTPVTPPLAVTGAESRVLSIVGIWLFGAGSLLAGLSRSRRRIET